MLVSAAIDPYKKSYGNSRSSSATAAGSNTSERMTASPRKTCVPGVQACARLGVIATAMIATMRHWTTRPKAGVPRLASDAKALPLPPNRSAQILELRLHHVVDRLASAAHVVGHAIVDLLVRDRVPEVLSALRRPSRARRAKARRAPACPPGAASDAAHHGRHGPLARRAAAQHVRQTCT